MDLLSLKSEARERGASVIEFAVILPLLLIIFAGTVEFGIILYDKAMLTNAVREGARYGIADGDTLPSGQYRTVPEITTVVTNYCTARLINFGSAAPTVNVTPKAPDGSTVSTASVAFGYSLTVDATYPYNFLFVPNFIPVLPQTLTLHARVLMRYE